MGLTSVSGQTDYIFTVIEQEAIPLGVQADMFRFVPLVLLGAALCAAVILYVSACMSYKRRLRSLHCFFEGKEGGSEAAGWNLFRLKEQVVLCQAEAVSADTLYE